MNTLQFKYRLLSEIKQISIKKANCNLKLKVRYLNPKWHCLLLNTLSQMGWRGNHLLLKAINIIDFKK